MDSQKQVVHFQALRTFSDGQSDEQQRRWSEEAWENANRNGRIDRSRVNLNFEIVKGGRIQSVDTTKSIYEKFQENIRSRGIADPNKGSEELHFRTVVDFVISGSHDTLHRLAWGYQ